MQYVIAGATSGTGDSVIKLMCERLGAQNITCLVRPTSDTRLLKSLDLKLHTGDVTEPETLQAVLSPQTIYIDMTHPKYYDKSLEAVVKSGVERAFFVTTTGIFSKYNRCSEIYKVNEAKIRASGITYTILRPSMIYGPLRDKNIHLLIKFLQKYPVFPLFGAGRALMQPVYVEDLAKGIVRAIEDPKTEGAEYNLAGPKGLEYREIVQIILRELGREKKVARLNIGLPLAYAITKPLQFVPGFPINEEQVLRLLEDKVFDISKAQNELDYRPRPFRDGIRLEIAQMRATGELPQFKATT